MICLEWIHFISKVQQKFFKEALKVSILGQSGFQRFCRTLQLFDWGHHRFKVRNDALTHDTGFTWVVTVLVASAFTLDFKGGKLFVQNWDSLRNEISNRVNERGDDSCFTLFISANFTWPTVKVVFATTVVVAEQIICPTQSNDADLTWSAIQVSFAVSNQGCIGNELEHAYAKGADLTWSTV